MESLKKPSDGEASVAELTAQVAELVGSEGLDALTKFGARQWPAHLAEPRAIDFGRGSHASADFES